MPTAMEYIGTHCFDKQKQTIFVYTYEPPFIRNIGKIDRDIKIGSP